jgi:hypothetical protein
MRNDVVLRCSILGLTAALGLVGCAEEEIPLFPQGTGQAKSGSATVVYPDGPYGISKESRAENFEFVGFPNAMADTSGARIIQLSDFYNPTGADVFPEGSPYGAGEPKPRALLIVVSSVWCGPCQYEASEVLPGLYAKYRPIGGEFLLALADGPTPGVPAEMKHLYNWTQKYDVDYPAVIDPASKLGALFEADAFPANIIVRTTDMTIIDVISGAPPINSPFWATYAKVAKGLL